MWSARAVFASQRFRLPDPADGSRQRPKRRKLQSAAMLLPACYF